jgi:hypothetical protein
MNNWMVVWNIFCFSICWECHHPNWQTPSFFRGVGIPPTRLLLLHITYWIIWIVIFYEWITIYNLIHIDEWWDSVGMKLIMSLLGGSPPNGNSMAEL